MREKSELLETALANTVWKLAKNSHEIVSEIQKEIEEISGPGILRTVTWSISIPKGDGQQSHLVDTLLSHEDSDGKITSSPMVSIDRLVVALRNLPLTMRLELGHQLLYDETDEILKS